MPFTTALPRRPFFKVEAAYQKSEIKSRFCPLFSVFCSYRRTTHFICFCSRMRILPSASAGGPQHSCVSSRSALASFLKPQPWEWGTSQIMALSSVTIPRSQHGMEVNRPLNPCAQNWHFLFKVKDEQIRHLFYMVIVKDLRILNPKEMKNSQKIVVFRQ